MANIVITSSTKWVKMVANDLSDEAGIVSGFFSKDHIAEILCVSDGFIEVRMDNGDRWPISFEETNGAYKVDNIDGNVPSSNDELMTFMSAFIDY